jgi:hypothetical protein
LGERSDSALSKLITRWTSGRRPGISVAGFVDDLAAASGSDQTAVATMIADDSSSRKTRHVTDQSIDRPGPTFVA